MEPQVFISAISLLPIYLRLKLPEGFLVKVAMGTLSSSNTTQIAFSNSRNTT